MERHFEDHHLHHHWQPPAPYPPFPAPPPNFFQPPPQHQPLYFSRPDNNNSHHFPIPHPHPHPHPNFSYNHMTSNEPVGSFGGLCSNDRKRGKHCPDPKGDTFHAKLYVAPVPSFLTEENIRPLFEEHGHVVEIVCPRDKRTGQRKGYIFLKYATTEEADGAIRALHGQYTFPGEKESLRVKYADKERERLANLEREHVGRGEVEDSLYVGAVNKQASKEEVLEIFSPYGAVEDVYIAREFQKPSRGYAFIKYARRDMAVAAIKALNGAFTMRGCDEPLVVRFSDPKKHKSGGELRGNHAASGQNFGPCSQELMIRQAPSFGNGTGGCMLPNPPYPMQRISMYSPPQAACHTVQSPLDAPPIIEQELPLAKQPTTQLCHMPPEETQAPKKFLQSSQQAMPEMTQQTQVLNQQQSAQVSLEEVLVASDTEKQFDSALENAGKPEMSLKLETNGAENAPNSTGSHSRPSTNSSGSSLDVPVTVSQPSSMKMPIESREEILHHMTILKTYVKRSKKTPMAGNVAAAQNKSLLGETKTVASQVDKLLFRIKELPQKIMQEKALGSHSQMLDLVTERAQSTRTPLKSLQVTTKAAKTTTCIDESEDKEKEAGNSLEASDSEEKLKITRTLNKCSNDLAGGKIMGLDQQTPEGSSHRRKKGIPRRLVIQQASDTALRIDESEDKKEAGNPLEASEEKLKVTRTLNKCSNDLAGRKFVVLDQQKPEGSSHRRKRGTPCRLVIQQASDTGLSSTKTEKREKDIDRETIPCADVYQCLPFVKRSMFWKTIESMEVFQMVPQRPHFRPLADCKEEYREGSAIGAMVTFAFLFDKTTSLKFDDSRRVLESMLESLADLERHGFDVTIPRDRVNQLLSIKDRNDKLESEFKDAENQIEEHSIERTKLDANRKDIEKKIAELQEQLTAARLEMDNKDCKIDRLQTRTDSENVQINKARSMFEKVVSAPWKSSEFYT